ncbi:7-cyano-7-deazaguanine/7-aminomethyl-7-deazaguanine transporter [Halotalea alkalilenta]|uniref:7-cyano-7-deazaguanine/7-aminomethyl-7- deazaguanine transporter n=1 Tax=Halotalea alkalilenta TaxID=376489 RepID=UPI00048508C5|nr:7-cyano-7-deazaguanine/7-aminomethyl-7-deazaguanine transporter [Halotalea alkalilenta]
MFALDRRKRRLALAALVGFHILIITASNYLVQLPVALFGLHTTWGAFSFPFIFLTTDLTVRLLGKRDARILIAQVMAPALVISYVVSVLWQEAQFRGFQALGEWNLFVARIALASFAAYVLGQLLDIQVFDRLRRLPQWWVAPAASTLFGMLIDTLAFFAIAFHHGPNAFLAEHWVEIALVDYVIKLGIGFVLFVPLYGALLKWILARFARVERAQPMN